MAEIKLDFFFGNHRKVLKIITGGVIKTLSSLVTSARPSKQLATYSKFNQRQRMKRNNTHNKDSTEHD